MAEFSYQYDFENMRIVLEQSNQPVAVAVTPGHGLLLASAPLFKVGCVKIEEILVRDDIPSAERVQVCRELLATLLESYQREQIRLLPETP